MSSTGCPAVPNPPIMTVDPSLMPSTASRRSSVIRSIAALTLLSVRYAHMCAQLELSSRAAARRVKADPPEVSVLSAVVPKASSPSRPWAPPGTGSSTGRSPVRPPSGSRAVRMPARLGRADAGAPHSRRRPAPTRTTPRPAPRADADYAARRAR
ncbi:hypothetical protein GCM10022262_08530 [Georgenia daeguensis]|uniref:LysR family transcriptional regulator n=1 Tax=Georgenia daeguensis TaxID=908355 RepID=A0ABP8ER51_9MICO